VHACPHAPRWKRHTAADGRESIEEAEEALLVEGWARDVGDEIGECLEEDDPEVLSLLGRCVQLLGEEACRALLVQTWQVEETGGLLTTDGTNRRRTAGGVFFWLVKQKAPPEQRVRLFGRRTAKAS